jgi:hypothetical protein
LTRACLGSKLQAMRILFYVLVAATLSISALGLILGSMITVCLAMGLGTLFSLVAYLTSLDDEGVDPLRPSVFE